MKITSYEGKHSCARVVRTEGHRGAAPWVIGHVFKDKYSINSMAEYSAHNVREEVKTRWGVNISYLKAWRSGESYWVRAGYAGTIVPEVTVLAIHVEARESWDVNRLCARW